MKKEDFKDDLDPDLKTKLGLEHNTKGVIILLLVQILRILRKK